MAGSGPHRCARGANPRNPCSGPGRRRDLDPWAPSPQHPSPSAPQHPSLGLRHSPCDARPSLPRRTPAVRAPWCVPRSLISRSTGLSLPVLPAGINPQLPPHRTGRPRPCQLLSSPQGRRLFGGGSGAPLAGVRLRSRGDRAQQGLTPGGPWAQHQCRRVPCKVVSPGPCGTGSVPSPGPALWQALPGVRLAGQGRWGRRGPNPDKPLGTWPGCCQASGKHRAVARGVPRPAQLHLVPPCPCAAHARHPSSPALAGSPDVPRAPSLGSAAHPPWLCSSPRTP